MYLNGIDAGLGVLDFQTADFDPGNDLPYVAASCRPTPPPPGTTRSWRPSCRPTCAPPSPRSEQFAVERVRRRAGRARACGDDERAQSSQQLARYTGLSAEYIERTDLRIEIQRFIKELLRDERRTVGRLDSRFKGIDRDAAGEQPEDDPTFGAADGAVRRHVQRLRPRRARVRERPALRDPAPDLWRRGATPTTRTGTSTSARRCARRDRQQPGPAGCSSRAATTTWRRRTSPTEYTLDHLGARPDAARQRHDGVLRGRPHDVHPQAVARGAQGRPRSIHRPRDPDARLVLPRRGHPHEHLGGRIDIGLRQLVVDELAVQVLLVGAQVEVPVPAEVEEDRAALAVGAGRSSRSTARIAWWLGRRDDALGARRSGRPPRSTRSGGRRRPRPGPRDELRDQRRHAVVAQAAGVDRRPARSRGPACASSAAASSAPCRRSRSRSGRGSGWGTRRARRRRAESPCRRRFSARNGNARPAKLEPPPAQPMTTSGYVAGHARAACCASWPITVWCSSTWLSTQPSAYLVSSRVAASSTASVMAMPRLPVESGVASSTARPGVRCRATGSARPRAPGLDHRAPVRLLVVGARTM